MEGSETTSSWNTKFSSSRPIMMSAKRPETMRMEYSMSFCMDSTSAQWTSSTITTVEASRRSITPRMELAECAPNLWAMCPRRFRGLFFSHDREVARTTVQPWSSSISCMPNSVLPAPGWPLMWKSLPSPDSNLLICVLTSCTMIDARGRNVWDDDGVKETEATINQY